MFIDKDKVKSLYKEDKPNSQEDLQTVLSSNIKYVVEIICESKLT